MNYAVENQSDVSASYVESMEQVASAYVDATPPVQYPNTYANHIQAVEQSQKVSEAYNEVAYQFQGQTTGYDAASFGYTYGMEGATFDAYA